MIGIAVVVILAYLSIQNVLLNDEVKRLDRQFGEAAWRTETAEQQLNILKKQCRIE